jgi:hypothetical protein
MAVQFENHYRSLSAGVITELFISIGYCELSFLYDFH